jgi:hypothetical protein
VGGDSVIAQLRGAPGFIEKPFERIRALAVRPTKGLWVATMNASSIKNCRILEYLISGCRHGARISASDIYITQSLQMY